MAYYQASSKVNYIGESSDIKPTTCNEGASFYEINTGVRWLYHDGKWIEDISMIYALSQALNNKI